MPNAQTTRAPDPRPTIHAVPVRPAVGKPPSLPPHVLRALSTIYDLADQRLREHEQADTPQAAQQTTPQD